MFDVNHPVIQGLPKTEDREVIRKIKQLTGRPVGINLEPLEQGKESSVETNEMWKLSGGRVATLENAKTAVEMGVDFIVLTGNPGIGVTNAAITDTLKLYREHLGEQVVLIAGKMHASGILSECGEHILTEADVRAFAEAGADIILLPAPGTVPGITMEYVRNLVVCAHSLGKMTLTAIGTSQEGADTDTIKEIALMCKMTGTDLHHLGDAGYGGFALKYFGIRKGYPWNPPYLSPYGRFHPKIEGDKNHSKKRSMKDRFSLSLSQSVNDIFYSHSNKCKKST